MAQQLILLGTTPNDGTGDTVRVAFEKTNSNFTELYTAVDNIITQGTVTGTGEVAGITLSGNVVNGVGTLTLGGTLAVPIANITATGDKNSTTFLRGDGTWAASGSVTSVSGTGTVAGLTLTGTVTSSGSLTLGGTLAVPIANIIATGTASGSTFLRGDGSWASTLCSVGATFPLVSSGGNDPVIGMPPASFNSSGYLTSTDWNNFNNKGYGSVTLVTGAGTVSGLTLTGNIIESGSITLEGSLIVQIEDIAASGTADNTSFLRGDGVWAPIGVLLENLDASGTADNTTFLRGDNSWNTAVTYVNGTGTVSGLTLTGDITTSGSLTLGGALSVSVSDIDTSGTASASTFLRGDGAWENVVTRVTGTGTVSGLTLSGTVTGSGSLTLGGALSVSVSDIDTTGTASNTTFLRGDGAWASTVSSVSGTGTVSGLTLSGTVTDSGSLVLGGTLEVLVSNIVTTGTASANTFLRGDGAWVSTVASVSGTGSVAGLTLSGTVTNSGELTLGGTLAVPLANITATGSRNSTTYLRGDGTWATVGTVTSVSGTGTVSGLTLSGNISTTGSLTLGGTLSVSIEDIAASGTASNTTFLRGDGSWATTGTVTSVSGTGTVAGLTLTGNVTTNGNIILGGTLAVPVANITAIGTRNGSTFLRGDGAWSDNIVTSVTGTGTVSGLTLSGTVTNSGELTLGGVLEVQIEDIAATGTASNTTFLRGDGVWAAGGTVTSVSGTGTVSGLTLTGTVTNSGSLTLGGTLSVGIENIDTFGTADNTTFLRGDGVWAKPTIIIDANGPLVWAQTTVPSISIPAATTNIDGYLTHQDWNTFNEKSDLKVIVGGTSPSYGLTVNSFINSSNEAVLTLGGTLAVPIGNITATGSANTHTYLRGDGVWSPITSYTTFTADPESPLVITGSSQAYAITIPKATSTTDGYLSKEDWNVLVNKGTINTITAIGAPVYGLSIIAQKPVYDGDIVNLSLSGDISVPVANIAATGTPSSANFLRGDGSWSGLEGVGSGTVVAVVGTGTVSGLTLTGNVTTSGFLTLGGELTVDVANIATEFGTADETTFLRGDGTWSPAVTSVSGSGSVAGLTLTGNVSTNGSLVLGGTLAVPVPNISASGTASSTTFLRGDGMWHQIDVSSIIAEGTADNSTYLRGDGTWSSINNAAGTVTSVSGTGTVAGLTLSGTVTSFGSLQLSGDLLVEIGNIDATGIASSTTYLRGDGAWATAGTVTSVSGTGTVAGLTLSGAVTGSGFLTLGGTLAVPVENITASGTPSSSSFLRGDGVWSSSVVTNVVGTGTVCGIHLSGNVSSSGNLVLGGNLAVPLLNISTIDYMQFTSGSITGTFAVDDVLTASPSGATGVVLEWDAVNRILKYSTSTGDFLVGDVVTAPGGQGTIQYDHPLNNTTFLRGDGTWAPITSIANNITKSTDFVYSTLTTSTLSWNSNNYFNYHINLLSTSLNISNDVGSPVDGQKIVFRIKDNGTSQTITWPTTGTNPIRVVGSFSLPASTTAGKVMYITCYYNSYESVWDATLFSIAP